MKKLLPVLLIIALTLALFGCANNAATDSSNNTMANDSDKVADGNGETVVAYSFGPMTGGAAWGQFEKGFNDACEELGWEGHYLAPTADNNMTELINLQETAITNGADVMIPLVVDVDAMSDMLDSAVEKGIAMVAVYQSAPQIPGVIGTDAVNLGYNIAEALAQCMEGKEIHVVTMQTTLSTSVQNLQVDAFEERLLELCPDAVIVRREECNSSAQTAQDKLAAVCIANPETNALVSFDSYAGLVLPSLISGTAIFLMRQYFLTLPKDYKEAATLDGCGDMGFLFHIAVPLSIPTISSLAVYLFVQIYNQFFWPLLVTNTDEMRTIQIGISFLVAADVINYGHILAGAVIAIIPSGLIYIFGQDYIIKGMTAGGLKG